jgi:urea transport system ATP-binding protein
MRTLLYVDGLTVSFDGFLALRNLSLILDGHERIRLLIGPNGAGKTTLFDVLTGHVPPVSGQALFLDQVNLLGLSEHEIANRGVKRKFQTPSIFPHHTVFENMVLSSGRKGFLSTISARAAALENDRIAEVLEQVGLLEHARQPGGTLSHGQQQWLEIAMLLAQSPTLLLLDEPVAGMTRAEKEKTAALLETIVQRTTGSIMLIEHDMEFVRQIAHRGHRVSVLHEGTVLSEGPMDRVQSDERVIEAYLGRGRVGTQTPC